MLANIIQPGSSVGMAFGLAIEHCCCNRTMQEFKEWAMAAASKYGYTVEVDGIGSAIDEDVALAQEPLLHDVGFATQAWPHTGLPASSAASSL